MHVIDKLAWIGKDKISEVDQTHFRLFEREKFNSINNGSDNNNRPSV